MEIAANSRGWLAAALALVLVGCGPMAVPPRGEVAESRIDSGYRFASVVQASAMAGLPVEVRGSAAGLSDAALADAVVDAMPNRSVGLATRFQRAGAGAPERVVWRFGAEGGRLEAVCEDAGTPPAAAGTRLAVAAAYCRGPQALTAVRATADDIASAGDPAFGELIAVLTLKLFPQQPPTPPAPANLVIAVE